MTRNLLEMMLIQLLFISASTITEASQTTSTFAPFASLFDKSLERNCSARCERLYNRSLNRIGYSIDNVAHALRLKPNTQDASVICWKFLDYDDCERQCENSNQATDSFFSGDRLFIVRKCSKLVSRSPYLKHFKCLHRFHTFLEVRCSSYAKEATRYRYLSKLAKTSNGTININASLMPSSFITKKPRKLKKDMQMSRETLIQETCRYLHYHSTCLSNAVFNHCPNASDLFNRFTLLDYFLSFVVPKNDQLFTDRLLDYCQMYDFQKIARDLFDSTKTTIKRHTNENEATTQPGIHLTRPITLPSTIVTRHKPDRTTRQKSLFASDEDLTDVPPNFYYSSAKYTKAYREALERLNFYRTTTPNHNRHAAHVDEFELISHPVPLDFDFENRDDDRHYSKRTPSPILLTTDPDLILTEAQLKSQRLNPQSDQRRKNRKDEKDDASEEHEEGENIDEEDYSPPILWPRKKNDYSDDGPLFRNEKPHIFRIRQYGVDDNEDQANERAGKEGKNLENGPTIINHSGGNKMVTRLPYDYFDYEDENDHDAVDPNEITYPGRRERERTTKAGQKVPSSFGEILKTFVTTALRPTTQNPHPHGRRSDNSFLWLITAYSLFFITATVILASLIFAMIIIRRRRRHDYYKTFLIKKPHKF